MNKTKWMMAAFFILAVCGLSLGLVSLFRNGSVQALSPTVPAVIALMPESASFVAYVDVRKILYSPVYKAFENEHGDKFTTQLQEMIRTTGIDPRNDIDSVAFCSSPSPAGSGTVRLAIVSGRFDREKLTSLITVRGKAESTAYKGTAIYGRPQESSPSGEKTTGGEAVCFLDGNRILFGHREAIQSVVDISRGEHAGVASKPAFLAMLNQTSTEGSFWVVGTDMSFLKQFQVRGAVDKTTGLRTERSLIPSLPPVENFLLQGDLGNVISVSMQTRCKDEKTAQNVNDFLRGMIALGKLTVEQKPELAGVMEDIQVSLNQTTVSVRIQMPFEDLKKLHDLRKDSEAARPPVKSAEKM